VRHVDDAHLAERERQAERGQQEDRPHAQPVEHLGDQDSHATPLCNRSGADASTPHSVRGGRPTPDQTGTAPAWRSQAGAVGDQLLRLPAQGYDLRYGSGSIGLPDDQSV
jgi:hypothetical protein